MSESAYRRPYPALAPYATGRLAVGEGHELFYELCGNPQGRPAVFLHGGPGSGAGIHHRRLFDPAIWNVCLFDQRGCGRSTPLGSLEANTTWHLVADLERLRLHLGFPSWLLFGGSWGATLALAYGQAHPSRVDGMVLRGIFSGRRQELDWFYRDGANRLFPDRWERFVSVLESHERGDVVAAFHRRLTDPDRAVRARAARAWTDWEAATVTLRTPAQAREENAYADAQASDAIIAFARIENHYFSHSLWLEEGQLVDAVPRLSDIPAIIVQGRYDVVTPAATAYAIAARWPRADLRIVEAAGHAFAEPGILHELLEATDRFGAGWRD
ncbi:prolyl aminopeptidase [Aurantimonas sp. Leaf443]|uniref:prolyl aminopeptidase n=1 Tax=Aurantimonas sp. Leaf443 TaxID=1736378 RepID=UPI0006F4E534|nr:prolyl aminopeptidase [Aurantimonas sp. Leaf443]KQT88295.1 proline iminopeptidase [Aurantimonas sp. Leaf443]